MKTANETRACRQKWRQVLIIENGRNGPPLRGVPAAVRGSILRNEKAKLCGKAAKSQRQELTMSISTIQCNQIAG
jgi:hypothetical protein